MSDWPTVFLWLAMVVPWIMGIGLAKNAILTLVAVIVPPYAWVLTAQWLMGVIA